MEVTNLSPIEDTQKFVVTQSNSLIEAEYSTELTARAHKTARLILSLISPDDKNLRLYTIRLDALKKYLGIAPNTRWGSFYKELDSIANKLNKKPIRIPNSEGGYIRAMFLSGYEIRPKTGTVTFEISSLLKPHLLELKKNYTSYLLTYIPKLRSSYSIRLYELLHQYRRIGKRYFELEDIQKKVGSNYPKYSNFKIKVLKRAQKELKALTDLSFVFHEKKEGRKVKGIEFIIFGNKPKSKQSQQLSFIEDAIEKDGKQEKPAFAETIVKAMNELGISEQNIVKYLAMGFDIINGGEKEKEAVINRIQTLENYYLEKLELTKHSGNRENAAGFFIKALKEDWTSSKALQKGKATSAMQKRKAVQDKLKKMTAKVDRLTQQKRDMQVPIIAELLADDTVLETAYNAVMEGMNSFLKRSLSDVLHLPIREQYEKTMRISSGMRIYLLEHYPERFEEANAIDQQIEKVQKEIQTLNIK
jgi:Protein involved in initiation of plasmid replication